jgi:hypothetical protein
MLVPPVANSLKIPSLPHGTRLALSRDSKGEQRRLHMERQAISQTTLGDLIVALTEETSQFIRDEKEVHKVVAFMVTHLLNGSGAASRRWQ